MVALWETKSTAEFDCFAVFSEVGAAVDKQKGAVAGQERAERECVCLTIDIGCERIASQSRLHEEEEE